MNKLNIKKAEKALDSLPAYSKKSFIIFKERWPHLSNIKFNEFRVAANSVIKKNHIKNKLSCLNADEFVKYKINEYEKIHTKSKSLVEYGFVSETFSRKYNDKGLHVIMPCFHAPHYNASFYNSFKRFLTEKRNEIVALHIIGDFLDMQALSSHDINNISANTLDKEYRIGNRILDEITSILSPNILKTYIWGNHEDRYNRYMRNVNNAKLGTALQSPTEGLKLTARGFHVFENWKQSYITIGEHLTLCHGEFVNIHTAKKHIDTYRKSVMYAHTHRKQVYIEGNTGGFNIGSMANFDDSAFGYASRAMKSSWTNSFSTVFIDDQGYYHVEIPSWVNNRFIYGGKTYL
jgi:hypothetical protein